MRRTLILAILTVTCLLPRAAAAAQSEFPITPDPADCVADPIDVDELAERSATPTLPATMEPPGATATATPEIREQVVSIIVSAAACTNANQPLRALSYFTDDYLLHRFGDEPSVMLGHLEAAATRDAAIAPIEDRVSITDIVDVFVWPVGGGAQVVLRWSSGVRESLVALTFRPEDGALKIDAVIAEGAGDFPPFGQGK